MVLGVVVAGVAVTAAAAVAAATAATAVLCLFLLSFVVIGLAFNHHHVLSNAPDSLVTRITPELLSYYHLNC